jgi:iron complex transport system substrate-binding protein
LAERYPSALAVCQSCLVSFPFDTLVWAFYDPRAMGDSLISWRAVVMVLVGCCSAIACDRRTSLTISAPHGPRVASLVPAATDMLLGMGAGDHLVAVSNYETSPRVARLPRVGDYQTTDWETLARLRPDAMIIQIAPDRVPPGLKQRADELHIALVNVKIDRLEDVFATMHQLGKVAGEADKARGAADKLRREFDELKTRCATQPSISTLLVRDENGSDVIGPDNFLDDLLKIVNATNAAGSLGHPYPSIDREKLISLAPEAVIVLLPGAKPQTVEVSRRFWASMTRVPAVQAGRVSTLPQDYALVPGARLADLARDMARCLRPEGISKTRTTAQETAR